jgi:hypothetical protein
MGILRAAAIRERAIRALVGQVRQVAIRANMPSFSADPFIPTSYRNIVGWWSAVDPSYYVSQTSSSPAPNAFPTVTNVTVSSGISDPNGGNGAYRLTENLVNSSHSISCGQTDFVPAQTQAGDVWISFAARSSGPSPRSISFSALGTSGGFGVNLQNGSFSSGSQVAYMTVTSAGGGWWRVRAKLVSATPVARIWVTQSVTTGSATYTGDGVSGVDIYPEDVVASQVRVSTSYDLSDNGNDRTQPTVGNRPFALPDFGLSTGMVSYSNNSTQVKQLVENVAVATALSGSDQPFTWIALCRWERASNTAISSNVFSGATASMQLMQQSAYQFSFSRTDDGAVTATVSPDPVLSGFTPDPNWHAVSLVFNGTSLELYIDGQLNPTAIPLNVGACTFTSALVNFISRAVREETIFSRALTTVERTNIETGFLMRAGLPTPDLENPLNVPGTQSWWETDSGVLLSSASISAVITGWTQTNTSVADNGDGSYRVSEDTDITGEAHTITQSTVNSTNGTAVIYAEFRIVPGGRQWVYMRGNGTSPSAWFDIQNGVIGTVNSGATASITALGGGWYGCRLTYLHSSGTIVIGSATSDGAFTYGSSDGRANFDIRNVVLTQDRVLQWLDKTPTRWQLLNTTANIQPNYFNGSYVPGAQINSMPTVGEDQNQTAKQLLYIAGFGLPFSGTDKPGTFIGLIRKMADPTATTTAMLLAGTTARQSFLRYSAASGYQAFRTDNAGVNVTSTIYGNPANNYYVYEDIFNGTQESMFLDGVQLGVTKAVDVGASTFDSASGMNFRSHSSFGHCMNNRVLTNAERVAQRNGFLRRAGLL